MAPDRFGIDDHYYDARGVKHETSRATRAALRAAMGVTPEETAPAAEAEDAVRVWRPGDDRKLGGPADLVLEDGTARARRRAAGGAAVRVPPSVSAGRRRDDAGGQPPALLLAQRFHRLGLRGAGLRGALARKLGHR